jgi:hypothetical protein
VAASWGFRITNHAIEVIPPDGVPPEVATPLADIIFAEIRTQAMFDVYRQVWGELSTNSNAWRDGISGNGTSQTIDGDKVVLESQYEQYESVRISKKEFERFLDQYAEFLRTRSSR